jgi:hypothetical protein
MLDSTALHRLRPSNCGHSGPFSLLNRDSGCGAVRGRSMPGVLHSGNNQLQLAIRSVSGTEDMNKPGVCPDDGAVHDSVGGKALYCARPTRTRADMSGKTSTFEWRLSVGRSSSFNALKHLLQIMLGALRVSVVIGVWGGVPTA